jgi:hypothetical protein
MALGAFVAGSLAAGLVPGCQSRRSDHTSNTGPAASPASAPPAQAPDRASLQPGVAVRLFQLEGTIDAIPTLADGQTPNADDRRQTIDLADPAFAAVKAPLLTAVRAVLDIAEPGEYHFRLTSDDGARLLIDGSSVVKHDGRHGVSAKTSDAVTLAAGLHTLAIDHFDAGGHIRLLLEWQRPGSSTFEVVPADRLLAEIDNARVVAPGVKALQDQRRPGDGKPVAGVHPSYSIDHIEVEGFNPMVGAMTFLPDGRLIVGTFSPLQRDDTNLPDIESKVPDKLYALSGLNGDPKHVTSRVVADGLYEPLGLCAIGKDLYVSHRREVTHLIDKDGDGFFETHETVASGWAAWNYHQFTFGLVARDNKIYAALSTAMAPPAWKGMMSNAAPNDPLRGSVLEIDLTSKTVRAIAGGVRTPNGLGFGPEGSLFYSDNQGTWMPSNNFTEIIPGHFYGHYNNTNFVPKLSDRFPTGGVASIFCDQLRTPTTIDLVHNDLCNSPTQSLLIENGPYAGQMLIGELTAGGIRRAFLERVNGQWQGAAFQFSQGFSCGINRLALGPNGILMAGGIGAGGNWNWKNTRSGLDRLTPTGKVAFEMLAVRAKTDGFEIEFTKPVAAAWLAEAKNYAVRQWMYEPTEAYGGERKQVETLRVASALPSSDGRRVRLTIPGLKAGRTVELRTDPVSTKGEQIWSTYAYYNLNHIPAASPVKGIEGVGVGVLPPADAVSLIGRSARTAFTVGEKFDVPPSRTQPEIQAGPMYADVAEGDLFSRTSFGDCRLHVEWYSPPGGTGQLAGNSGVYLQERYEIQVLGTLAESAPLQPNDAGAIYNKKATDRNASTGPGTWQAYDILFTAPRFTNGKKIADARVTLYWNGQLVHNNVAVDGPTGSASSLGESDSGRGFQIGRLKLQAHATAAEGPVRYRNIWIAPLSTNYTTSVLAGPTPGPWIDLTADGTLDRFVTRGGNATYTIDHGEIVGTSVPHSPNTFLMTKDTYSDFELLFDAKQDVDLNSGVQVRSDITAADGGFANRAGRVRGYQVELDPSPRAFSGGIYDEGRRGWLAPLTENPAARACYKPNDWNQIRVVAHGSVIRTWINGVPAASIMDATDASGHIGLQVHDVGERAEPMQVRWRNLRIRKLSDH